MAAATSKLSSMNGLDAEEMLALHTLPLFGLNGFAFGQGYLEIVGLALAPGGDPSAVNFEGDAGIVFEVEYPLPNKGAEDVYWYWPNANTTAFRLRIDLAATRHEGEFYNFNILFSGSEDEPLEDIRTRLVIPKDLSLLENFPSGEALKRVQRYETVNSVAARGLSDAVRIIDLANHYGWSGTGAILDWGVGHGRVARYLRHWTDAEVYGIDIDPYNAAWADEHLPYLKISHGPLMPPTEYEDASFSLIYAISVMTHLTKEVQEAWLEELYRIMEPGGVALLTFAGDASAAFASRYLDRAWMDEYKANGRGPYLPDQSLVGVIETPEYYKNVKQTSAVAADMCRDAGFEVLGVNDSMFGYQDLVAIGKPKP